MSQKTIFEKGRAGRRAFVCPPLDVPARDRDELLPPDLQRRTPPRLPEVSEPEIVRHYVRLSKRNFDLDSGFYPLGSCTMKHNPRLHERVAALPGYARLHPLQRAEGSQGALELMWRLEGALGEIAGLPHVSLQPSAGSHGELAGVLLTRAYHEDRGERRHKVLTPDTAHGTNPATVTMAGYEVVKVGTDAAGGIDLDDLRAKADEDVACLMLTNPNTLGPVRRQHRGDRRDRPRGRRDPLLRRREPERGDGADQARRHGLRHRPLQPAQDLHPAARRRRPGGRARSRSSERIEPYLMVPRVARGEDGAFALDYEKPKSIGRLRGFQGNFGTFVRTYAYICSLGAEGLQEASEVAVLNANYLLARLREEGVLDLLPLAFGELCGHEFVLSGAPMKRELGIKTLDLAKRLLDHGVHPPTVYFPLLVEEALLIEPTETETKETLDEFVETDRRRSCARRGRIPRSRAPHHIRRRSDASMRPAPPATRSSARR